LPAGDRANTFTTAEPSPLVDEEGGILVVDEAAEAEQLAQLQVAGKPGLDGHSNGAEQVAIRARDLGMEVIYEGIRLTPAQIVRAAVDEDVHVVGLSILSGSHLALLPA
jgi:ethylmalonyl-CoA mutase